MDSVRLGRALGAGTRRLAKTVVEVSQAVSAPGDATPSRTSATPLQQDATSHARATPVRVSAPRVLEVAKRTGFWKPLARFTSVLWLEVTGTFFTIFALVLGSAAWKNRALWHQGTHSAFTLSRAAVPLYGYTTLCAVFSYFAVSSFIRARRREQSAKTLQER